MVVEDVGELEAILAAIWNDPTARQSLPPLSQMWFFCGGLTEGGMVTNKDKVSSVPVPTLARLPTLRHLSGCLDDPIPETVSLISLEWSTAYGDDSILQGLLEQNPGLRHLTIRHDCVAFNEPIVPSGILISEVIAAACPQLQSLIFEAYGNVGDVRSFFRVDDITGLKHLKHLEVICSLLD